MSDLTGPLDSNACKQGYALLKALPPLASGQSIGRIYDHWTVEAYGCVDGSYNIVIALEGGVWAPKIACSPTNNAVQVGSSAPYAAHTYHRNSHAIGIAVNGMAGATTSNFGDAPIQIHEIEVLCATNAAVALAYHIDLAGSIDGEHTVMTHAEAALADGYFGERWDLARLHASSAPLSAAEAHTNADLIRTRSHEYKLFLRGDDASQH
jgi:hypothetical protein